MIDYSNFKKSLKNLEEQNQNYKNIGSSLPQWNREAVAESVIQRFEICHDCLWKILRRYMEEELGISEVPTAPKPLSRSAFKNGLLSSSVEQWLRYIDARIGTTHDYSGEKAQEAIELIDDFIDDTIGLYQTMTGETWE